MTTLTAQPPIAPKDAPVWAVAMLRDIVDWVNRIRRGPQRLTSYLVAGLPDATKNTGAIVYVSNDATVGGTIAWSNGTVWKRPNATGTVS